MHSLFYVLHFVQYNIPIIQVYVVVEVYVIKVSIHKESILAQTVV